MLALIMGAVVILFGCTPSGNASAEPGKMKNGKSAVVMIHPDFSLTREDLSKLLNGLPQDIQGRVRTQPQDFLDLVKQVLSEPYELTVLVDKSHSLSETYAPKELVRLTDFDLPVSREDLTVSGIIMPAVLAMNQAATADGVTLVFSSAFRSYSIQKDVFAYNVRELGEEKAKRESAEPGKSQHQLGTTIDFGSITDDFANTKAGKWLAGNAWRFGFSMSYPQGREDLTGYKYESWHFRYIGKPAAQLAQEFFGGIQQYTLQFLYDKREQLANSMASQKK